MIAVNDSFWLNSLAYMLLIAKFRDHVCYTDLIDLFHLVSVVNTYTVMSSYAYLTYTFCYMVEWNVSQLRRV